MARQYKRFHPKNSKYIRKTETRHGQEYVKPITKEDFAEMVRLCLIHRDAAPVGSATYWKWYRNYIILIVGVNTGNRIETILEQTPRDYSGYRFTSTEHKTGKLQQYDLNEDVYKIVKKYIDYCGFTTNQFMFPPKLGSKDALTRQRCWRMIKDLAKEAGIEYEVGCHSLRKSYGRWIYDDTHDLLLVQSLLGHNSAETTMRYICLEANEIEKIRTTIRHIPDYE